MKHFLFFFINIKNFILRFFNIYIVNLRVLLLIHLRIFRFFLNLRFLMILIIFHRNNSHAREMIYSLIKFQALKLIYREIIINPSNIPVCFGMCQCFRSSFFIRLISCASPPEYFLCYCFYYIVSYFFYIQNNFILQDTLKFLGCFLMFMFFFSSILFFFIHIFDLRILLFQLLIYFLILLTFVVNLRH